jgi:hypothetical protein
MLNPPRYGASFLRASVARHPGGGEITPGPRLLDTLRAVCTRGPPRFKRVG